MVSQLPCLPIHVGNQFCLKACVCSVPGILRERMPGAFKGARATHAAFIQGIPLREQRW